MNGSVDDVKIIKKHIFRNHLRRVVSEVPDAWVKYISQLLCTRGFSKVVFHGGKQAKNWKTKTCL